MDDGSIRLRYRGRCLRCGRELSAGERAVHLKELRKVCCLDCHEVPAAETAEVTLGSGVDSGSPSRDLGAMPAPDGVLDPIDAVVGELPARIVGVAGASARAEFARRQAKDDAARAERTLLWRAMNRFFYPDGRQTTHSWRVGARGEEMLGQRLEVRAMAMDGFVLHDRLMPRSRANIDHLVVSSSGVLVIDTKHYAGAKVRVGTEGGLFGPVRRHLLVDGRRRDPLVEGVHRQVGATQGVLRFAGLPAVPVVGVLCFLDADVPLSAAGAHVDGVLVRGPRGTARLIGGKEPVIDSDTVVAAARALHEGLRGSER